MMYFTEYLIHSKEGLLNTIRSYSLLSKQNGNQYYHNLKAAKTDDAKPPLGGILWHLTSSEKHSLLSNNFSTKTTSQQQP